MSQREPFEYVEIDVDYCDLTYGEGACTASLGTTGERKCFNMFAGCQDQENFAKGIKTLRLCKPVSGVPVNGGFFPVLRSVSVSSPTVNIGGTNANLSALGKRGTLDFSVQDFAYHDRGWDKYQAERISGAAQTDEGPYNPEDRGTFFGKLRKRFPYYSGRPARYVTGYIDSGVVEVSTTQHFVLTNMAVSRSELIRFDAKDILDLADNKKAVAPKTSNGVLLFDVTNNGTEVTLQPEGIGDLEYPASGSASMGSELVKFTRAGDVFTLTERGVSGTSASNHSADDTFQLSYSIYKQRLDTTIRELLVDYAGIDPAFIPDAAWKVEIDRWAGALLLTTDIPKPEGVAGQIGELATLGVSIWWDDINQVIGLKMIRPVDTDTVFDLSEDSAIKAISSDDMDDKRITEVGMHTVIVDPMRGYKQAENYKREFMPIDILSKSPNAYGDTRKMDIFMRWLNHGDDRTARSSSRRILKRMKSPPIHYTIQLDQKDGAIALTDVLRVKSRLTEDETGKPQTKLLQVLSRKVLRSGHDFEVTAQAYVYEGRFGFIMPDDSPIYDSATQDQRERGCFLVDENSLVFSDNSKPYEII